MDLTAIDKATDYARKQGLVQWAEAFNVQDWEAIEKIDRPGIKEAVKTMETIMANPLQGQLSLDRQRCNGKDIQ